MLLTAEPFWPVFIALHVAPLSVLRKMPRELVPRYTIDVAVGSIVNAVTIRSVNPEFLAVQLVPPLVLLKTPPPELPAYSTSGLEGSIASDSCVELVKPELTANHESAPSVLFAMPPLTTLTTPKVVGKLDELVEPVIYTSPELARSMPRPASSPAPPRYVE